MINQSNKIINSNLKKLVNKTYEYGFSTKIEKDIIEKLAEKMGRKLIFVQNEWDSLVPGLERGAIHPVELRPALNGREGETHRALGEPEDGHHRFAPEAA